MGVRMMLEDWAVINITHCHTCSFLWTCFMFDLTASPACSVSASKLFLADSRSDVAWMYFCLQNSEGG